MRSLTLLSLIVYLFLARYAHSQNVAVIYTSGGGLGVPSRVSYDQGDMNQLNANICTYGNCLFLPTLDTFNQYAAKVNAIGTQVIAALDKCSSDLSTGTSDAALKQRVETLEREVADLQKQLATR